MERLRVPDLILRHKTLLMNTFFAGSIIAGGAGFKDFAIQTGNDNASAISRIEGEGNFHNPSLQERSDANKRYDELAVGIRNLKSQGKAQEIPFIQNDPQLIKAYEVMDQAIAFDNAVASSTPLLSRKALKHMLLSVGGFTIGFTGFMGEWLLRKPKLHNKS